MSFNNGLGKVTQKNIQLQNFNASDGITAIKHGNGRDWWVFFKSYSNTSPLDVFYSYFISPSGISGPFIQHIGIPTQYGGFLRLKFTKDGKKLFAISPANLFEFYDFDRCTGLLSNTTTVQVSSLTGPYINYWGFDLSADGTKLYTTPIYQAPGTNTS